MTNKRSGGGGLGIVKCGVCYNKLARDFCYCGLPLCSSWCAIKHARVMFGSEFSQWCNKFKERLLARSSNYNKHD